ncbi:MAG: hypothetical protein AB7F22_16440 [Reyranella sp.]|uniref:hypothetical protein n=1 Tax=Reyranella sp. TaxID=1929291 RepID=UPI003D149EFB
MPAGLTGATGAKHVRREGRHRYLKDYDGGKDDRIEGVRARGGKIERPRRECDLQRRAARPEDRFGTAEAGAKHQNVRQAEMRRGSPDKASGRNKTSALFEQGGKACNEQDLHHRLRRARTISRRTGDRVAEAVEASDQPADERRYRDGIAPRTNRRQADLKK